MNFTTTRVIDGFGQRVTDRKGAATRIVLFFQVGIVFAAKELRQAIVEFSGRPYPGSAGVSSSSSLTLSLVRLRSSRYADVVNDEAFDRIADGADAINSYQQLRVGNRLAMTIREFELLPVESIYLRVEASGTNVNTSVWYHIDSVAIGLDWWDGREEREGATAKPSINFETVQPR